MSDDEDIKYVKRQRTLHYGSLEEVERKRLQQLELQEQQQQLGSAAAAKATDAAGSAAAEQLEDIESEEEEEYEELKKPATVIGSTLLAAETTSAPGKKHKKLDDSYYDVETEMTNEKIALLEEFERKRRARQINVSTDDNEVKQNLRQLNEPICYFGEGPAERRRRLKELMANLGENVIKQRQTQKEERRRQEEQESTWYHEGPQSLRLARLWIADYSLPRAKTRLEQAREALELPGAIRAGLMVELQKRLQCMVPKCSQVGDTRPLSCAAFNENSTALLTCSWSGVCKLWSVPSCELQQTLRGHAAYVGGVAFRPGVKLGEKRVVSMASSSHDGAVKLWAYGSEESIADITGHMPHRVSKVKFHPSGRFLATACYDASWRLWDLEQKCEVLHQEGHAKAVHCISFQTDGSVLASGGLDAFGRVWDLRTGRCIMFLDGHLGAIYGLDFSPNGHHIATASQDNSCKIWDLRRRQPVYTIPAHVNLISDVRYEQESGSFLATCSYDSSVKLWSHKTWQPLKTLQGHDGQVTSVDISPDSKYIVSTSFDRTYKLWSSDAQ